jgi:hypothetical protein
MSSSNKNEGQTSSGSPLTYHEKALRESGKELLLRTGPALRNFCQLMIKACLSAIPIYFTLLRFLSPTQSESEFSRLTEWQALGPPMLFLLAVVLFSLGYFPKKQQINLNDLTSVRKALDGVNESRRTHALYGGGAFALGVLWTFILVWTLP